MKQSELDKLKTTLADEAAQSDIECYCKPIQQAGVRWWDTAIADDKDAQWVERAVEYLDARRKLDRHAFYAHWVRVVRARREKGK